jgi:glycosyltransferase involved in cell wall biosynthesis
MKILYFSLDYTHHDHQFLSALAKTEHEVHYVRLERGKHQAEERPIPTNIHQVQWMGGQKEFHWAYLPRLTFEFRHLTERIRPDLVHAGPIQTCGFIAAVSGFHPLLTMSWGFDLLQDADRNAGWRWVTRFTLRHSTFFTSDAEVTRQKAVGFGMRPERTSVFPWGVDLERFTPGKPSRRPQEFVLICNRSWEPRYGVDILAHAFVRLARERQDIRLLLIGTGSQAATIRQILENGGVAEQVTFTGQVPQFEQPGFYQRADMYISPSHVDGSSVSLMEALSCGLPCLVSDIPANREWILEGINGWLFPDGDAEALAAKIGAVLERRNSLIKIRRAARCTAEEKADWRNNFSKLLDTYRQTVRQNA